MSAIPDDELDAMTADEARARFCFCAWIHRRDVRKMRLMQNALNEAREDVLRGMQQHKCDDPKCGICEWNRYVTRAAPDADPSSR